MIFQNFGFNRQAIKVAAPAPGGGVVTTGLIAYYDIGNPACWTSGTTLTDLSGNGNDGTLVGSGIAYSGSNGGVLSKDTTSSYIQVPTSAATSLNAGTDATIMQWIKLAQSPPPTDAQVGFIYMTNMTNDIGLGYPYTDNNIYSNLFRDDRPSYGNPVSNLAVWHVMTTSTSPGSGNWKMFINMTSQATDTGTSDINLFNNRIRIGVSGGGSEPLVGALGPTLIYTQQLSTGDMQTNIDYFASRF